MHDLALGDIADVISGLRVRVIYDSRQALVATLFGEHPPVFKRKNYHINFIIHSEHATRKIKILAEHHEINLDDVRIFKIGIKNEVPFGRLAGFIKMENEDMFEKLVEIFGGFDRQDVVFLLGFYTIPFFHDDSIRKILNLFERIPEDITVIMPQPAGGFERSIDVILGKIFDVDLVIKRSKGDYFNEAYTVQMEQSIIPELKFFARIKIYNGKLKLFRSL